MKKTLLFSMASVLVAMPSLAQTAQETKDDEIVLTGMRLQTVDVSGLRPIPVTEVTSSATVLTPDIISIRETPYIADQLRAVPGLGVSRSGSKGGLTQVRIRGAEANHTLVLVDGIEVSDPTTGETNFGLLSGLNVENIEVLRGEQSGIFGTDAIGGVVNVITKSYPENEARIEYGSFNTISGEARTGHEYGDGSITLSASGFKSDGIDTSGHGGEKDGTEQWAITANGRHTFANDWDISGLIRYSETDSQFDGDTDFDGLLNDVDLSTEAQQLLAGASFQGEAFGIDHLFRASYTTTSRDNFQSGLATDSSEGTRSKLAYSPSITFEPGFSDEVRLTGVVDYEKEEYDVSDVQYGGFTNQSVSFETIGFGAETMFTWDQLNVLGSLRYDDNDGRFDDAVTGRIGASYDADDFGRIRASVGTGTKNPTFTELFGFFPGSFVGNPSLKPETSTGWEIGWNKSYDNFEIDLSYFQSELEDEIYTAFTPTFLSTPMNRTGKSKRSGIELAGTTFITDELTAHAQLTLLNSEADDGSAEIRVPEQTTSLSFSYQPYGYDEARFGLALDFVGEQDDFDFGSWPARRVTLDSYLLVAASAELPVNDTLAVTLRGENLFDQEVADVYGYATPGAAVFVGLKLR